LTAKGERRIDYKEAKQADYIGFLHRHPYATDAYELGFAPGVREDYSYLSEDYPNVDLPVVILDNDFHDPDRDRYLKQFKEHDPSVAILGDAYTPTEARQLDEIATQLKKELPYKEPIIVPKCREAFQLIDEDTTLGYPLGYSTEEPEEFSELSDWRGRKIHLLGSNPMTQYETIQELTQPTITGDPPSDIAGVDWNAPHKGNPEMVKKAFERILEYDYEEEEPGSVFEGKMEKHYETYYKNQLNLQDLPPLNTIPEFKQIIREIQQEADERWETLKE